MHNEIQWSESIHPKAFDPERTAFLELLALEIGMVRFHGGSDQLQSGRLADLKTEVHKSAFKCAELALVSPSK